MEPYKNFAGLEGELAGFERSAVVILPISYDYTSTWIKGADRGPFSFLEASGALEYYDIETDFEVYKKGIHTAEPLVIDTPPEDMVQKVEKRTRDLIDAGKFIVGVGGEHSVSIGLIKAHALRFGDISVLQLDAHSDLRDEYEGSRYNHACVMARVLEICPVVQVGIRSMDADEKSRVDAGNIFFARDIAGRGDNIAGSTYPGWVENVIKRLNDNVFVTIDLDVFDPSIMPATGTPEPGGLSWYDVTGLLRAVSEKKKVIGFDCMELCPDQAMKYADFTAAKLVYKFLSYIFKNMA